MYFFKHFHEDTKAWGLHEGLKAETATVVKTSDGARVLQSPYPDQIDLIIDDLERFGEIEINDDVLNTPDNSLYNIFSLSFHIDELRSNLEDYLVVMLSRDEIFFNTANGPPLEEEQIIRKASPLNAIKNIFGDIDTKFALDQGLARYLFEQVHPETVETIEEFNNEMNPIFLVDFEDYVKTDFYKKFHNVIRKLEDRELICIQFLVNYFGESISLCYLLIKGLIKQGEFFRAILACRYELLEGYVEETTNAAYREAYALWQNEVTVALNYLKNFIPPEREQLLKLVESKETISKEFKASLRYSVDPKSKLFKQFDKTLPFEIIKAICGMVNKDGGEILVGYYEDTKTFVGIEKDGLKDLDAWELHLRNMIGNDPGEFVGSLIDIKFLSYQDGITCALIRVEKSASKIFCKDAHGKKHLYQRDGARTISVSLADYILQEEQDKLQET